MNLTDPTGYSNDSQSDTEGKTGDPVTASDNDAALKYDDNLIQLESTFRGDKDAPNISFPTLGPPDKSPEELEANAAEWAATQGVDQVGLDDDVLDTLREQGYSQEQIEQIFSDEIAPEQWFSIVQELALKGRGSIGIDDVSKQIQDAYDKVRQFFKGEKDATKAKVQRGRKLGDNIPGQRGNIGESPPTLKRIHSDETIMSGSNRYSYDHWTRQSTDDIVKSLKPGVNDSLKIKPDGRIFDGNTRIKVLQERGYDINSLPREVLR